MESLVISNSFTQKQSKMKVNTIMGKGMNCCYNKIIVIVQREHCFNIVIVCL